MVGRIPITAVVPACPDRVLCPVSSMEVADQDGQGDRDGPDEDHRDPSTLDRQEVYRAVVRLVLLQLPPRLLAAAGADAVVLGRPAVVVAAVAVALAGPSVLVPSPPAFDRDPLASWPAWSRVLA